MFNLKIGVIIPSSESGGGNTTPQYNWIPVTGIPSGGHLSVSVSYSGTDVAICNGSTIYISSDGSINYSTIYPAGGVAPANITDISIVDGGIFISGRYGGYTYNSLGYGRSFGGTPGPVRVDMYENGEVSVFVEGFNPPLQEWTMHDFGATLGTRYEGAFHNHKRHSADNTKLVTYTSTSVLLSTDSGATFTDITYPGAANISGVAIAGNGTKIVVISQSQLPRVLVL